ncbi:MAG: glycosyltransferase [archaeon]
MKTLAIVIPAHNEEEIIRQNVEKTMDFLEINPIGLNWKIYVAENGSTDNTIKELKKIKNKNFRFIILPVRSRSKAILGAWKKIDADYYMFMDADLSTDINHIPKLVGHLKEGYDIVIGSRRMKASQVKRVLVRKVLSEGFHLIMRVVFNLHINDYQCGFKVIDRKVRDHIIPQMRYTDEGFLDTELLAVAHSKGYKIKEIPVHWYDIRPSKFKVYRSIYMNLFNSYRIKRDLILGRYN